MGRTAARGDKRTPRGAEADDRHLDRAHHHRHWRSAASATWSLSRLKCGSTLAHAALWAVSDGARLAQRIAGGAWGRVDRLLTPCRGRVACIEVGTGSAGPV